MRGGTRKEVVGGESMVRALGGRELICDEDRDPVMRLKKGGRTLCSPDLATV